MIDREKVLTVLRRRFPSALAADLAAAANAIVGLPEDWEDVTKLEPDLHFHFSRRCGEACVLASDGTDEFEFRVLRRAAH